MDGGISPLVAAAQSVAGRMGGCRAMILGPDEATEPREPADRGEVGVLGGPRQVGALGRRAPEEIERLAAIASDRRVSNARATTHAAA